MAVASKIIWSGQNTRIVESSNSLLFYQRLRAKAGEVLGRGEEKTVHELNHPSQTPLVVGFVKPEDLRPFGNLRLHDHNCFHAQKIAWLLFPENFPDIHLAGAIENREEKDPAKVEELKRMPFRSRCPWFSIYKRSHTFSSFFVVDQLEIWEGQRIIEAYEHARAGLESRYPHGFTSHQALKELDVLETEEYKEAKAHLDTYFPPLLRRVRKVGIAPQTTPSNIIFKPNFDTPIFMEVLIGTNIYKDQIRTAVNTGKTRELKGEDREAFDFHMHHINTGGLEREYKAVGTGEFLEWAEE